MKKLSLILSSVLVLSMLLSSCALSSEGAVSESSSTLTYADSAWLENRIGNVPDGVSVGTADEIGIDMTDFEDDGYIIKQMGGETVICGKTEVGLDMAVRKYAKLYENGTADGADISYHEGYRIEKLTICGNDLSEYSIVLPDDGVPSTPYAVSELQRLLKIATGITLPIVKGEEIPKSFVFRCTDDESLSLSQGYEYFAEGDKIVFCGREVFGCATAVYNFLERECSWVDLTYGDSVLTESDLVEIPSDLYYRSESAFDYYLPTWTLEGNTPENGGDGAWENERGIPGASNENTCYSQTSGRNIMGQIRHANHGLISLWHLGFVNEMICLSSMSNIETVEDSVRDCIESNLASGKTIGKDFFYVDISQADTMFWCHCKECYKVMKEENGAIAGTVVRFANYIEETMDEDFDGLTYLIFAYHGSNVPPKTAPNEDISVTFCFDGSCANHRLDNNQCQGCSFDFCDELGSRDFNNNDYAEWLREWCRLSDKVLVWYYGLPSVQPCELSENLYYDLRFMTECGIMGVYFEFEGSPFTLNRIYNKILHKFMWNPNMSYAEYNEFIDTELEKEYGDGWMYIREYMKIWNESERIQNGCWNVWTYAKIKSDRYDFAYFTEHFDESVSLMDKALDLTDNAVQEKRLSILTFTVLYKGCYSLYMNGELSAISDKYNRAIDILRKYYNLYGFCDEEKSEYFGYDVMKLFTICDIWVATEPENAIVQWTSPTVG